jgi:thiol-disulfide isomerase/thioredoxin
MTDAVDVTTYSDDKALGQVAPSLSLLEPVKGERVDLEPGKVHVLFFFNTFYKGAYAVNEELTQLHEKFPDVVFIAISNDAEKEKVEKFLAKVVIDENHKKPLRLAVPYVFFDDKKATAKMYADVSNLSVMSCPMAYIIDRGGKIAWRQQFLQTFTMRQSNFEAQLVHVLAGDELESAGPRPKIDADEGEAAECGDDMSLF